MRPGHALKTVKCAGGPVEDETAWQNGELGDGIREIVPQSHSGSQVYSARPAMLAT
jgi:hypothetical protein